MEGVGISFLLFFLLFFLKIYALELQTMSSSQFLTDGDTLVSQTRVFKLGFFQSGGSGNKYLGIMYNKIAVTTVVWVANRKDPITGSSPPVLKIGRPGILVLFDNLTIIWSSDTRILTSGNVNVNVTATLRDSGNLVLMDQNKKVVWQSFDYPTDTLLPGMKLGSDYVNGIEWRLSSWRNSEDPSVGEFTWGADTLHYPESKLRQGAVVKFRGGPWKNQRITGVSQFDRHLVVMYSVIVNKREVSFSYNMNNSSMLARVAVNSSGQLESSVWVEDRKRWQLALSLPMDVCDGYNVCSAYGICSLNKVQQSCACLDETRFVPRNRRSWEAGDWSGGCVRRTPLDCRNGSDGFVKYAVVKLPDTGSSWFNLSMSLEGCEAKCLANCTCRGYANPDISVRGGVCLLWFSDLIDIRAYSAGYGDQDIFVRMASSELGHQSISKKKEGSHIKIILSVIITGILLTVIISTWLWYAQIKRRHEKPRKEGSLHILKDKEEDVQLPLFSFSTIVRATTNFSIAKKLGEGGFGPVFKGVLEDGQEIAVKRLSTTSRQGDDEFKNEVICISKLQHRNLVKILGCCIQGDEKLLVYEFMPNKSLDTFIFDRNKSILLDWRKRFDIIKGIARGLHYLHHDSRLRIIHRDLKAGNVLLDENMNPKISDFGLARSFGDNETHANTQRVVGTYGYMSPEYARDGLFSVKSDVFSFGVLVLEIVSGTKNRGFVHPEHDNNLIGHAWSMYNEGRSMELVDASLLESCHPPEVLRSIQVGLLCVQQSAEDRPNMLSVITMLVGEGALRKPKQPAYFMGRDVLLADISYETNQQACSINGISITEVDAR